MTLDGSQVNLFIAFVGGIATFFASCFLPLVPTYLAYLSGIGLSKGDEDSKVAHRKVFSNGVVFTLGFISIFVLLGATANSLGRFFAVNRELVQQIGGAFFIIIGFFMLEIIKPASLFKEFRINLPKNPTRWQKLNSFLVGVTFGFAWTPCIGPLLAVILFWASQSASLLQGVGLLFFYGLGMGVPFLLIAFWFEKLIPLLAKVSKYGRLIQIISGIVIGITGILLITGSLNELTIYLIKLVGISEVSL